MMQELLMYVLRYPAVLRYIYLYFAKIAHKIAKSKYFPNVFDDSDFSINSLSDDI